MSHIKKIIFPLLFLLPFLVRSQTVNNQITVQAPRLIDSRSGKIVRGQMVPFSSVLEANLHNRSTVRCPGLTVGINAGAGMKEYWYQSDTTDKSLVLKFEQRVTAEDFGAVGDSMTDNTVAIQAGINYCAANHVALNFNAGIYLSNTLFVRSKLSVLGVGKESVVLKINTGAGDGHLFKCSEVEDIHNISFKDIKLDGNVLYSNHVFAAGSPIKDSSSVLVSLVRLMYATFDNVYFNGCENAVFLSNVDGLQIKNCTVENIGGAAIVTNYSNDIKNVTLDNDRFLTFGCRDHWDVLGGNVRFGDVAFQGGGSHWKVLNSFFFDGAGTKWPVMECRFVSDILIQDCIFDGNGVSSMSLSIAGEDQNFLKRIVIKDNHFVNIAGLSLNASDSLNGRLKYEFSSYHEFVRFKDYSITGNFFENASFGIRGFSNGVFSNNNISDSTFLNGAVFTLEDTTEKMLFVNNNIYGNKNQGQIFRFDGTLRQSRISENFMHFDDDGNRNIFAFVGTYANQFNGLTIAENTIKGFVYILFSSNIGLGSVTTCYVRGNDFSATNISRPGMFFDNNQSAGFIIKDNSFKGGRLESDSLQSVMLRSEFTTTPGQSVFVEPVNVSGVADFFINGVCISKSMITFSGRNITYSGQLPNNNRPNSIFINYYN